MKFSVILVNYNGLGWTVKALESVLAQNHSSVEVIVVDSGSKDDSVVEIKKWIEEHPDFTCRLLPFVQNVGFAMGCNKAFDVSSGELIFLLNNDAEMQSGVLHKIEEMSNRMSPRYGSFMCSMRFMDTPSILNSTGIIAFWDGSAMDRSLNRSVKDQPSMGEVLGPCGGAAVWRRSVIEKIGFLREEFFMYNEDVDMALRSQRAGYSCLYVPEAVVLHKGGATAKREPKIAIMRTHYRNVFLTLERNFPWYARLRGGVMFVMRFGTGFMRYGWADTSSRIGAIRYTFRNRKRLAGERRQIRSLGPDDRVLRWVTLRRPKNG